MNATASFGALQTAPSEPGGSSDSPVVSEKNPLKSFDQEVEEYNKAVASQRSAQSVEQQYAGDRSGVENINAKTAKLSAFALCTGVSEPPFQPTAACMYKPPHDTSPPHATAHPRFLLPRGRWWSPWGTGRATCRIARRS